MDLREQFLSYQGPIEKKIIFFDMDGVLTEEKSSWNFVHRYLGIDNSKNYSLYKEGKITYSEFLERDIESWINSGKCVSRSILRGVLSNIKRRSNFTQAMKLLKTEGYSLMIVSGGIMDLCNIIDPDGLFTHYFANVITYKGDQIVPPGIPVVDPKKKDDIIRRVVSDHSPEVTVSVGDSYEDEKMFKNTDFSVCFNGPEDYTNPYGVDLKSNDLLHLLKKIKEITG
ncbi:HAD-IB family phosphatase [Caldiplasma sukawensis]